MSVAVVKANAISSVHLVMLTPQHVTIPNVVAREKCGVVQGTTFGPDLGLAQLVEESCKPQELAHLIVNARHP